MNNVYLRFEICNKVYFILSILCNSPDNTLDYENIIPCRTMTANINSAEVSGSADVIQ